MTTDLSTLKAAVEYPWDGGEAGLTLVIGGILTLLSPLIIPGLFVLGYAIRVVEVVLDDRPSPPRFDDWRGLLRDGLEGAVVLLVYAVLPLALGLVALAAAAGLGGFRFAGPFLVTRPLAAGGLAMVVALLFVGLLLVVAYVAPAALLNLVRSRRLQDALAVDRVRRIARSDDYAGAWLVALAVFAAAGVLLTVLYTAAFGVVLSGFVTFYALVAMAYLYAHGAEAAGVEPAVEAPSDADDDEARAEPAPETDHA